MGCLLSANLGSPINQQQQQQQQQQHQQTQPKSGATSMKFENNPLQAQKKNNVNKQKEKEQEKVKLEATKKAEDAQKAAQTGVGQGDSDLALNSVYKISAVEDTNRNSLSPEWSRVGEEDNIVKDDKNDNRKSGYMSVSNTSNKSENGVPVQTMSVDQRQREVRDSQRSKDMLELVEKAAAVAERRPSVSPDRERRPSAAPTASLHLPPPPPSSRPPPLPPKSMPPSSIPSLLPPTLAENEAPETETKATASVVLEAAMQSEKDTSDDDDDNNNVKTATVRDSYAERKLKIPQLNLAGLDKFNTHFCSFSLSRFLFYPSYSSLFILFISFSFKRFERPHSVAGSRVSTADANGMFFKAMKEVRFLLFCLFCLFVCLLFSFSFLSLLYHFT